MVWLVLGALLGISLGHARAERGWRQHEARRGDRRYGVQRLASSFDEQLRQEMEREDRTSVRALFGGTMRASDARAPPAAPPLEAHWALLMWVVPLLRKARAARPGAA